jgi:predicted YcjX-like family ATPase
MDLSGVSPAAAVLAVSQTPKIDRTIVAVAKAQRVQREQGAAVVSLIEQASAGGDIGRIISVRA